MSRQQGSRSADRGRGERIWTFLLVPNQGKKSPKSLSWRQLQFFGPLSVGQVWTSPICSSHCNLGRRSRLSAKKIANYVFWQVSRLQRP